MKQGKYDGEMSREEIITRLNESAEKSFSALMKAYEVGVKEGLSDEEEDKLIELLRQSKDLKEKIRQITSS